MFAQRFRALPLVYLLLAALCAVPAGVSGQPNGAAETPTPAPSAGAEEPGASASPDPGTEQGPTSAPEAPPTPAPPSATAETPAAPAESPAGPAASKAAGRLHVVVFKGDGGIAEGALLQLSSGAQGTTDESGSLILVVPPGRYDLDVQLVSRNQIPRTIRGIVVAPGKTSEVIVTIYPNNNMDADVMLPEGVEAEEAAKPEEKAQPQKAPGRLRGKVVGAEDQVPVAGASIFVAGEELEGKTAEDGTFELTLPAGKHTLSVIHPKFSTQTVRDVEIKEKAVAEISIELTPVAIELQDFVVTAPHISGGVASMIEERKNSATVSDAIGAEDIAKLPTNDAAGAAQRVVGATIVGGRFVYVRGLGERYSNALLNGAPLPSPEPDRATVPLDLFPSQILQSLDIVKTFTPDMPGNFAGGSVRITTKTVPEEETFALTLGAGANTSSTFTKTYGQESSSTDFLGFDDGMRALPDGIPTDYRLAKSTEKPDGTRVTRDELNEGAKKFDSSFAPTRKTNWPNLRGSITYGNGWKLGGDVRVGVLASLLYRRDFSFRNEEANSYLYDSEIGLDPLVENKIETTVNGVRWGAFGSAAILFGKDHKISLVGMRSQLADATTRVIQGANSNREAYVNSTRMEYAARYLTFGQLQGEHKLHFLNDAEISWVGSLAGAGRDADDTRDAVFQRNFVGSEFGFVQDNSSGRHFYANQSENAQVVGLDWRQPITSGWLSTAAKTGTLISLKSREFQARNFSANLKGTGVPCGATYDPIRCPNLFFNETDVGTLISIDETSQRSDAYKAGLDIYAGYLMGEVGLGESWKVLGGARLEQTEQLIQVIDPLSKEDIEGPNTGAKRSQLDVLPGGSVVYSPVEDVNIRGALSQTIARPQLRELAPFAFAEFFGGPSTSGTPGLKLTRILNADLRFEYFPTLREVLAVSVFAKDFTDPIEPQMIAGSGDAGFAVQYANTPGALLYGVEVEARKGLDFISQALSDFSVNLSLMLAKSEIQAATDTDDSGSRIATSLHRPMVQAAPYVINAAIDYDNEDGYQFRILYNVSGPKLSTVGVRKTPDGYEHPRNVIDISASKRFGEHFRLKLNIQNLLNAQYLTTLGRTERSDNVVRRYREGISASLSLTYSN